MIANMELKSASAIFSTVQCNSRFLGVLLVFGLTDVFFCFECFADLPNIVLEDLECIDMEGSGGGVVVVVVVVVGGGQQIASAACTVGHMVLSAEIMSANALVSPHVAPSSVGRTRSGSSRPSGQNSHGSGATVVVVGGSTARQKALDADSISVCTIRNLEEHKRLEFEPHTHQLCLRNSIKPHDYSPQSPSQ